MGTVIVTDETEDLQQKKSWRYKLTKPCRCFIDALNFPLGCLLFTVVYWLIFIPIFYYSMAAKCPNIYADDCMWHYQWKYLFWTFTSLAWVVIVSAAICYWSCKYGRDDDEDELEEEQKKEGDEKKEKDKLLGESVKYNNLKNEKLNLSIKNEKISPVKETTADKNNTTAKAESRIEKTTVTLPIRKSLIITEEINIIESENKPNEMVQKSQVNQSEDKKPLNSSEEKKTSPKQEVSRNEKPNESIMEEIDKMFPRCSMRRKPDQRRRPDTLIIHSPKYPREEQEVRRFTVQEHPKTTSPLTPREIFFQDLIEGAKRDTIEQTDNFLENERKNALDANAKKPKVKDYILKSRSGTEASSPEYFIASVSDRRSVTEAFLYVDGGQPQEALTICYIDQEDDVFKN